MKPHEEKVNMYIYTLHFYIVNLIGFIGYVLLYHCRLYESLHCTMITDYLLIQDGIQRPDSVAIETTMKLQIWY